MSKNVETAFNFFFFNPLGPGFFPTLKVTGIWPTAPVQNGGPLNDLWQ